MSTVIDVPSVRSRATTIVGTNMRGIIDRKRGVAALFADGGHLFEVFADGAKATQPLANIVGERTRERLKSYAAYFEVPIISNIYRHQGFKGREFRRRGLTKREGVVIYYPDGSSELVWGFAQFSGKESDDGNYNLI